ncbi:potassium channel family protein [Georgenia sp. Z1344]|uniref:potassium channel family protein n=1 Tax=Georgenia sp. Z1344 TaxID=3416706 RepID=UPI003CEBD36C
MKVLIAGAGSVGRSIALELLGHGHEVTLVDHEPSAMRVASVARADWLLADACSPSALTDAGAASSDVVVAATGDDKANLVISLLAKSEFAVPRVVARINNPKNEWMFTETWGVDVPVSTPRIMTSLVEEAVSVGDLVPLFRFHRSGASIHELTLPDDSPVVGRRVGSVDLGPHAVLAAVIRSGTAYGAEPDLTLEAGDELLLVLSAQGQDDLGALQDALAPH